MDQFLEEFTLAIKMGMLVKVKVATGMRKILSIGLVLFFVAGCGTSAQDKRNNYDACLIEMEKQLWEEVGGQSTSISENNLRTKMVEGALKGRCVKFLK